MSKTTQILKNYAGESQGVRTNLAAFLEHGRLAGTGKMVILPVDQGMEHGPAASFQKNAPGYDPAYHPQLAIDAGLNGYAAPIGFIRNLTDEQIGRIPTILKLNNSTSLNGKNTLKDQSITSTVQAAVDAGCRGIGLTIYPGNENFTHMMEEARALIEEARTMGLPSFVWSYPRGGDISKQGETALDIVAYAAHIAAQLGAHVIKVKPPTDFIEMASNQPLYESVAKSTLAERIEHVLQAAFNGKRMVIFSGGAAKGEADVLSEIEGLAKGGAYGSIVGRNAFQREKTEALSLLDKIVGIYLDA